MQHDPEVFVNIEVQLGMRISTKDRKITQANHIIALLVNSIGDITETINSNYNDKTCTISL